MLMVGLMSWRNLVVVFSLASLTALSAGGCAHSALSTDALFEPAADRLVLSMPELSCASCGAKVQRAVEALPGVKQAAFAKAKVEVGVAYDPAVTTPERILQASNQVGEKVVMGAGKGGYQASVEHSEESDTQIISRGEEVTLSEHLVPGKVTVVDFYADWCGPCRRVAVVMNTVMGARNDVALRKIDIVEWDTPVAKQHMSEVSQLPYTIIFNKTGEEVRRIVGLDLPALFAAIEEAGK